MAEASAGAEETGGAARAKEPRAAPKVRIVHVFAPEIVETDRDNFRDLVQRLTGKPRGDGGMMVGGGGGGQKITKGGAGDGGDMETKADVGPRLVDRSTH